MKFWLIIPGFCISALATAQSLEFIFADSMESGFAAAYRNTLTALRDPHVFTDVPIFGCVDFTDEPLPVVGISFNGELVSMIISDDDSDGLLDLSLLQLMDRLEPAGPGQMLTAANGACPAPAPPDNCAVLPAAQAAAASTNVASGLCLQALPGTISNYSPPVPLVMDNCLVTSPATAMLALGDIAIPLSAAQSAAGWSMDGQQLVPGLSRGFVSESDADTILLPDDLPLIGGQPLSSLLPGGQGSCAAGDDRDMLDGVVGWWFYFEFAGERVEVD